MSAELTLALTRGRILKQALPLLERAGIVPTVQIAGSRKLIFETSHPQLRLLVLRGVDVPTYVRQGAADLGIVGKDVLLEQGAEGMYEPLDLRIARCRLMTAAPVGWQPGRRRIRVATKFTSVARRYFAERGLHADVIKLSGALELAPMMQLADMILDLVETGNTLRANGMEPVDLVAEISSRLVINRAAMRFNRTAIGDLVTALSQALPEI